VTDRTKHLPPIMHLTAIEGRADIARRELKGNVMSMIRTLAAGLLTSVAAISAANAAPNIRLYDAAPDGDTVIDLSICSRSAAIEVAGSGHTNLDFYVYDWEGFEIFSDELPVDWMSGTFTQDFDGCGEYTLHVFNNGSQENRFVVRLTDL
jgi:hypothetical protein